jgi:hypothetical protein
MRASAFLSLLKLLLITFFNYLTYYLLYLLLLIAEKALSVKLTFLIYIFKAFITLSALSTY